jgi:hypothetical protein
VGAACLLGVLTVVAQSVFFGNAPIHFAPSLVALALVTLYLGYRAGVVSLVTTALLVNYPLLHPRWAWSSSNEALGATVVYLAVAAILVAAIGPFHSRLARLEESLDGACRATELETRLRIEAAQDFQTRLREMQKRCEKVLDLAQSTASISRYADSVVKRPSVVNAALIESPGPAGMDDEKNGIPTISAIHRQLIDLGANWSVPLSPLQQAMDEITDSDGSAFPQNQHPLMQAAKSSIVFGQRVYWASAPSVQPCEVSLFATAVADGRMLAVAISDSPHAPMMDSDPRLPVQLSRRPSAEVPIWIWASTTYVNRSAMQRNAECPCPLQRAGKRLPLVLRSLAQEA